MSATTTRAPCAASLRQVDEPMPPATEDAFWDLVSQEEILMMMRAIGGERKKLLNSLLPTPAA